MLCAGIGGGLTALKELGYSINTAHAIENDPVAAGVLQALHTEVQIIHDDVTTADPSLFLNHKYDLRLLSCFDMCLGIVRYLLCNC